VAAHDTVAILDLVAAESGAHGAALGDVHSRRIIGDLGKLLLESTKLNQRLSFQLRAVLLSCELRGISDQPCDPAFSTRWRDLTQYGEPRRETQAGSSQKSENYLSCER
jgi:hypothetical protein